MATSKASKGDASGKPTRAPKFGEGSVQWFNPKPNAQDIEWMEHRGDDILQDVITLYGGLQDRERLTVKLDSKSGRWLAILFRGDAGAELPVQAMSVRGATALDALGLLHYFYLVKFADGWQPDSGVPTGRFG